MIKIGQKYLVYPYNKWMVNEETLLVGPDNKEFIIFQEWKGGSFLITPQNEDEVEALQQAINTDEEDNELSSEQFEEFELYETTDGTDELQFTRTEFTDEEREKIQEAYDNDWFSGLSEVGYDPEDGWFTLWGKVVAEEYVEESM